MGLGDYPYTYATHRGRYWRFRRNGEDSRLPGKPGETAFLRAYADKMAEHDKRDAKLPVAKGSFAWLVQAYSASAEFRSLKEPTQLDYAATLRLIAEKLGDEPFRYSTRGMIKAVRDDYADTPRKAHKVKQMVSRLYSWADEESLVPAGFNPAKGIKELKPKGGKKEYTVWSGHEFDAFMAGAIEPMRTAAMLARYTGQRVQDVVKMVWTDYQGDVVRVRQSKTGAPLIIHCHPKLRSYLEDLKRRPRGMVILTNASGAPYNANSLSSAVGREVAKVAATGAMPSGRSLHGVRYMSGSDMEEAGCTIGQIEAVLGHQTFKMAMKYASQRLRAKAAIQKLEGGAES